MSGAGLAVFAALVAVVVGAWLTLFYLFPLNARAKFEYRATVLRDECLDAVLEGRLRRTAPVESFLTRASMMAAHAEAFTLTRALAVHLALTELGCDEPSAPSYESLRPEERRLMAGLDERLYRAFSERLVRGSSFGWVLMLFSLLLRLLPRAKRHPKVAAGAPSAEQLAREYSAVFAESVPMNGQRLVRSA